MPLRVLGVYSNLVEGKINLTMCKIILKPSFRFDIITEELVLAEFSKKFYFRILIKLIHLQLVKMIYESNR